MNWEPTLLDRFISILVFFWGMQDGDTDISVGINVRVPDRSFELHLWWHEWIILREAEPGSEKPSPVELAVVRDHQHHLPLVNIVVNQADADVRQVLISLHLLELPAEKGGGGSWGGHFL